MNEQRRRPGWPAILAILAIALVMTLFFGKNSNWSVLRPTVPAHDLQSN